MLCVFFYFHHAYGRQRHLHFNSQTAGVYAILPTGDHTVVQMSSEATEDRGPEEDTMFNSPICRFPIPAAAQASPYLINLGAIREMAIKVLAHLVRLRPQARHFPKPTSIAIALQT